MLRITTDDQSDVLTLKVEGKLAGPWVGILRDCWEQQLKNVSGQAINVDLHAVTFVDAAGKRLLEEMSRQGAKFLASGCLMKAIVTEISREPKTQSPL